MQSPPQDTGVNEDTGYGCTCHDAPHQNPSIDWMLLVASCLPDMLHACS